jgi:hypothetical protein
MSSTIGLISKLVTYVKNERIQECVRHLEYRQNEAAFYRKTARDASG